VAPLSIAPLESGAEFSVQERLKGAPSGSNEGVPFTKTLCPAITTSKEGIANAIGSVPASVVVVVLVELVTVVVGAAAVVDVVVLVDVVDGVVDVVGG